MLRHPCPPRCRGDPLPQLSGDPVAPPQGAAARQGLEDATSRKRKGQGQGRGRGRGDGGEAFEWNEAWDTEEESAAAEPTPVDGCAGRWHRRLCGSVRGVGFGACCPRVLLLAL